VTGPEETALLLRIAEGIDGLRADLRERGQAAAPAGRQPVTSPGGARFGNYGRNKGGAVAGASMADLEYYAGGCRRSLADAGKARFHDAERTLLAAIEAEIARQTGGGRAAPPADEFTPGDDDAPF
jgi:hypothetical protein